MGNDLAEAFLAAREVFQEVDEVLKQNLSRLMFEGPPEALTLTVNAQPALMAHAMAVVRVLEREGGVRVGAISAAVAGHSLGEYTALTAAGSFSLAEAARLLRRRGEAMQQAVPAGEGAMAALLGVELEQVADICAAAAEGPEGQQVVAIGNDNGGGQVVISGCREAVTRGVDIAKTRGVRRAMLLPVSAPFHCALMEPAADRMAEALEAIRIAPPVVPLIANVTAEKATEPEQIRDLLVQQVTKTVRWRESVQAMVALGIDTFVELGAGKVLTGLVRRIAPDATAIAAGTPQEIEALLRAL